jgi:DNA-directed RNA polymerase specialized sigma subunit
LIVVQVDEAYKKWMESPDPDNMSGVLSALDNTINKEIHRYQGPQQVLKTKARTLAVKAVKSYDPSQGAALNSWVVTGLKPLSRYAGTLNVAKTPEVANQRAAELHSVAKQFESENGREPSDEELADESGMSVAQVGKLRHRVLRAKSESMHMQANSGSGDSFAELPAATEGVPASYSFDIVYESLKPRERAIVDMKTGRNGKPLSNQEIAKRLGVSAPYVSQVSAGIAKRVQEVHRVV